MAAPSKKTILVVEDDSDIAFVLRFLLESDGFEVEHAADGRQALDFVKSAQPPALVLLDVMLPFANGFEILAQIRKKPEWGTTPVIILTARSQGKDVEMARSSGANGYIVKPFQPNELLAQIKKPIAGIATPF